MLEKCARVLVLALVSCNRNPAPPRAAQDVGAPGTPTAAAPANARPAAQPAAAPAAPVDAGPVLPEGRGTVTFRAANGTTASIPIDIARTQASINFADASGRGALPGRGLLLQYPRTDVHVVSMERIDAATDVVYVSANGRQILAAVKRAAPHVVTPPVTSEASASALLLPGGFLDANNLAVGDALEITSDRPDAGAAPAPAAPAPAAPAPAAPAPAAPAPAAPAR